MLALTDMQRRFVLAFVRSGGRNANRAAVAAGYSNGKGAAKVAAYRLIHHPKIVAALREVGERQLDGSVFVAISSLVEIAADPKHRDRYKACSDILDRCGFARTTRHEVEVTDPRSTAELLEFVSKYAKGYGLDGKSLVAPNLLEGDFVAVEPETAT